jgi:hypothetical protein
MAGDPLDRLTGLSSGARRLIDYVALLPGGARYAVLRHIARVSEEDMVIDLREAVDAGVLVVVPDQPNVYDFADDTLRPILIEQMGPVRQPRLQARAEAARRRVEGPDDYAPQ